MNTTKSTNRTLRQRLLSRRGLAALAAVLGLAVATVAAVLVAGSESRSAEDSAVAGLETSGDELEGPGDEAGASEGGEAREGETADGGTGSGSTGGADDGSTGGSEDGSSPAGAGADAAWDPEGRVPIDDPGIDFNDQPLPGPRFVADSAPAALWESSALPPCSVSPQRGPVKTLVDAPAGVQDVTASYTLLTRWGPLSTPEFAMTPTGGGWYEINIGPMNPGTVPPEGARMDVRITVRDRLGATRSTLLGGILIHSADQCR